MDRGEVLKLPFRVEPGENGSFIINTGSMRDSGSMGFVLGFSNADDLLQFLSNERDALRGADGAGSPDADAST